MELPATARRWTGRWDGLLGESPGVWVVHASWARGEPERGRYDDGELASWRRAAVAARREGRRLWVVAHAGALPDWQIAREGWLDADAGSTWGCWVERLGRALVDQVDGWFALEDPIGEAGAYDADARLAGRSLLRAQATAWRHLRRGSGGAQIPVGALVHPPLGALARLTTRTWIDAAALGRLLPPWGIGGELEAEAVLDVIGAAAAVSGAAATPRIRVDASPRP